MGLLPPSSATFLIFLIPPHLWIFAGWETIVCDWANLLMVDGRKRSGPCQTCTRQIHTRARIAERYNANALTQNRARSLLHCSWCWAFSLLCVVPPPPPALPLPLHLHHHLLLPVHLARSAAEERHNYPAGDAHACIHSEECSHTLVFGDPRRSLLLFFVTTGASLECVQSVCVGALCFWMLSRCFFFLVVVVFFYSWEVGRVLDATGLLHHSTLLLALPRVWSFSLRLSSAAALDVGGNNVLLFVPHEGLILFITNWFWPLLWVWMWIWLRKSWKPPPLCSTVSHYNYCSVQVKERLRSRRCVRVRQCDCLLLCVYL